MIFLHFLSKKCPLKVNTSQKKDIQLKTKQVMPMNQAYDRLYSDKVSKFAILGPIISNFARSLQAMPLKCSFVWCRKYHKSWWNGAPELHISVDLLCCTTVAELHNSVDLLCGITAAELHIQLSRFTLWHNGRELNNSVSLMRAPGVARIFQRQWRTILKVWRLNPKYNFTHLSNALEDSTNTERVKVRQNVRNRFKARQMCVDTNAISKNTSLLIAQDTQ